MDETVIEGEEDIQALVQDEELCETFQLKQLKVSFLDIFIDSFVIK